MMLKGFQSETIDSQVVFRKLLSAMTCPGQIEQIGIPLEAPGTLHNAAGAILLAVLDYETALWSDLDNNSPEIQWVKFHTGAPYSHMKSNALFGLALDYDRLEDPCLFNCGSIENPDQSATLIIQTRGIDHTGRIRLTGPGIKKETYIKLKGIKQIFLKRRQAMVKDYPLGIDMIFVCDSQFVCIPRTTKIEVL